jgi:type VI secretion system protein ImpH
METQAGTSADTLKFLRELEESPYRHDFFMALRRLECMHPDKPRFGRGARPIDEPVRLGQEPSMAFAPSAIASFEAGSKDRPHKMSGFFFGLFGPNGPLPLHLTEFARDRERNENDPTFRGFADIFHHRLLMLFYRAWADAQPTVSLDRETSRRIDTYVGSVFGIGAPEFRNRDSVPDNARLHMAGRLALQTKPAEGLLAILQDFFRLPFQIVEYVGEWLRLSRNDWMRLGAVGSAGALGKDAVIGSSVWNCQHKFRIVCGPLQLDDFTQLLPGGDSLRRLRDTVRGYIGFSVDWDLNLVLASADVPQLSLGKSGVLGWTTWLGERQSTEDADDIIIRPNVAQLTTDGPAANPVHDD